MVGPAAEGTTSHLINRGVIANAPDEEGTPGGISPSEPSSAADRAHAAAASSTLYLAGGRGSASAVGLPHAFAPGSGNARGVFLSEVTLADSRSEYTDCGFKGLCPPGAAIGSARPVHGRR